MDDSLKFRKVTEGRLRERVSVVTSKRKVVGCCWVGCHRFAAHLKLQSSGEGYRMLEEGDRGGHG